MSSVLQKHDMCRTTTNLYNLDIKLLSAAKVFICIIGIPLNAFLAVNIIRLRRLHSKPRNIFLLAIIFSNLFIFIPTIVQLIYLYYPLESLGQFFVFIEGLPLAHLLLNFSIALCVKYVALRNPLWHRKKANVSNAVYFILFCSLSVTCLLKFVYIIGLFPLSCESQKNQKLFYQFIIVLLFVFCIAIYSIVFKLSRKLVVSTSYNLPLCAPCFQSRYRNSLLPPIPFSLLLPIVRALPIDNIHGHHVDVFQHQNDEALVNIDINATANIFMKPTRISHRDAVEALNTVIGHSRMTISSTNSGIRVLMAKAIHTWVFVATSVIITILPTVLFFLSLSFCEITDNSECVGILNELAPYFEQLLVLIHATLNPIIWLLMSNELRLLPKL